MAQPQITFSFLHRNSFPVWTGNSWVIPFTWLRADWVHCVICICMLMHIYWGYNIYTTSFTTSCFSPELFPALSEANFRNSSLDGVGCQWDRTKATPKAGWFFFCFWSFSSMQQVKSLWLVPTQISLSTCLILLRIVPFSLVSISLLPQLSAHIFAPHPLPKVTLLMLIFILLFQQRGNSSLVL